MPRAARRATPKRRYAKRVAYRKKLVYRRRRQSLGNPRLAGGPGHSGFPLNKIVRMRYVQTIVPDISADGHYAFRANGIYDPDFTGTGHQPMGYDQWNQFYKRYIVIGSRCRVNVQPYNLTTAATPINFVLSTIAEGDLSAMATQPFSSALESGNSTCIFGRMQDGRVIQNTRMSRSYSAKKFWGFKDVSDNITSYGSIFGSDPTSTRSVLYGFVWRSVGTPVAGNLSITFIIDYIVKCTDPTILPSS